MKTYLTVRDVEESQFFVDLDNRLCQLAEHGCDVYSKVNILTDHCGNIDIDQREYTTTQTINYILNASEIDY